MYEEIVSQIVKYYKENKNMKTKSRSTIKEFVAYIEFIFLMFSTFTFEILQKLKTIKKQKCGISVNCSHAITTYNKYIGSIDLL